METQYTNIKTIVNKLKRNTLLAKLPFEAIVDYAADFLQLVNVPASFQEKVVTLEIKEYRALLPCDYYQMIQVRDTCSHHSYRYSTDSFHLIREEPSPDLTYTIQGRIIYTSIPTGKIDISYRAIQVDEEGYPVLPDTAKFYRAFENYVKLQHYTNLYECGELPDYRIIQNVSQEYAWAVGAYEAEAHMVSLDKAESLSNIWNNLLINVHSHRDGYLDAGRKEFYKRH